MDLYVITYPTLKDKSIYQRIKKEDYTIVVDGALDDFISLGIHIDLVVGDFDSLKDQTLLKNLNILKLPINKDITDTEAALNLSKTIDYQNLYLLGGIGGKRIEFDYLQILLFDKFPNLVIYHDQGSIYLLNNQTITIKDKKQFYFSFFAYDQATISLIGFKYPLENFQIKRFETLCISNQINEQATIKTDGRILVFETKK